MTRSRQTADWGSRAGLAKIVPSSVAVGSGTGSADSLGNVTFSGASSLSLNGCFTSVYDNYRVMFTLSSVSANNGMNFRLRASGTDSSATDYYAGGFINRANSATISSQNIGAGTTFELGPSGTAHPSNRCIIDFLNPFSSLYTGVHISTAGFDSGTSHYGRYVAGNFIATTSFDGFTIYPTTGNITGTIRVYGYTN
jgi:hypothetical protein